MEDLVIFVSEKSNLPRRLAKAAADAALEHLLQPDCPRLLKTYIEITLSYPELSRGEKDFLFASKILFPNETDPSQDKPPLND